MSAALKPNSLIPHTNGGFSFGAVPDTLPHGLPGGEIYLKFGVHRGPQNGFGIVHIWEAHKRDLSKLGYINQDDVIRYVIDIIKINTPIYCEFSFLKNPRLAILKSSIGLLIIEHRPLQDPSLAYSVITAYPRKQAHGVLVGRIEKAP
ncbi:MAG TPA: hypothetical protein PKZ97_16675 [Azospirillaceae bacterium]|nr:hypothetical protein [Azospirillaceae bacterium]HRQ82747.1 hypothetical protein [Azospirillaceae bacterium]